jgi:hypothetical protein
MKIKNVKRAFLSFSLLLFIAGCERSSEHTFAAMFYFTNVRGAFPEVMEVTSNGAGSKSYDIWVMRSVSEDIRNPLGSVKLVVVGEETTAIEHAHFSLSTNNIVFNDKEVLQSFKLTVMPTASTKTLTLKLSYTHPQLALMDRDHPGHTAKIRIMP